MQSMHNCQRGASISSSKVRKKKDLVEEVNTKRRLGYKLIDGSDRPDKLNVVYHQTVHLLEEDIPKQLQS